MRVTFEYRLDQYSISIWKSEDFTLYRGQMPLSFKERVGYDYRKNDNGTGIKMTVVQNVMRISDSQYSPTSPFFPISQHPISQLPISRESISRASISRASISRASISRESMEHFFTYMYSPLGQGTKNSNT